MDHSDNLIKTNPASNQECPKTFFIKEIKSKVRLIFCLHDVPAGSLINWLPKKKREREREKSGDEGGLNPSIESCPKRILLINSEGKWPVKLKRGTWKALFVCALFPPPVLLRFVLSPGDGWETHQYPHHYPHLAPAQSTQSSVREMKVTSVRWSQVITDEQMDTAAGHRCWIHHGLMTCRQRNVHFMYLVSGFVKNGFDPRVQYFITKHYS